MSEVGSRWQGWLPLRLFGVFLRIGAFTIGGGIAMTPVIEKEVVGRGWLTEEEFLDTIAVAQTVPGVLASNMGLYVGYRVAGSAGAFLATLGAVLPSFLAILFIAAFIPRYQNLPPVKAFFEGAEPAVVALLTGAAYHLGRKSIREWRVAAIAVAGLLAVWFLGLDPILAIVAGGVAGGLWLRPVRARQERGGGNGRSL